PLRHQGPLVRQAHQGDRGPVDPDHRRRPDGPHATGLRTGQVHVAGLLGAACTEALQEAADAPLLGASVPGRTATESCRRRAKVQPFPFRERVFLHVVAPSSGPTVRGVEDESEERSEKKRGCCRCCGPCSCGHCSWRPCWRLGWNRLPFTRRYTQREYPSVAVQNPGCGKTTSPSTPPLKTLSRPLRRSSPSRCY